MQNTLLPLGRPHAAMRYCINQVYHNPSATLKAIYTPAKALASSSFFRSYVIQPLAIMGTSLGISSLMDPEFRYLPAIHQDVVISSTATAALHLLHQKVYGAPEELSWKQRSLTLLGSAALSLSPAIVTGISRLTEPEYIERPLGSNYLSCKGEANDFVRSIAKLMNYTHADKLEFAFDLFEALQLKADTGMATNRYKAAPMIFGSILHCNELSQSNALLNAAPTLFSRTETPRVPPLFKYQLVMGALGQTQKTNTFGDLLNGLYYKTLQNAGILAHEIRHLEQIEGGSREQIYSLGMLNGLATYSISGPFGTRLVKSALTNLPNTPLKIAYVLATALYVAYTVMRPILVDRQMQQIDEYDADQHTLVHPDFALGLIDYFNQFMMRVERHQDFSRPYRWQRINLEVEAHFSTYSAILYKLLKLQDAMIEQVKEPFETHPLTSKRIQVLEAVLKERYLL